MDFICRKDSTVFFSGFLLDDRDEQFLFKILASAKASLSH